MPSAKVIIRCPHCSARYSVAFDLIGTQARCSACHRRFQVLETRPHITEDDILAWLNEGQEDDDFDLASEDTTPAGEPAPNITPAITRASPATAQPLPAGEI